MYNIFRVNYKQFPENLFTFSLFEEFLKDDTYLYLRTYGHEGKYDFDNKITPYENMVLATIKFINSVLRPAKMELFKKSVNTNSIIVPVHGFKYNGLKNKTFVFESDDTSSNLMTILATIKLNHVLGIPYSFSCKQQTKVSRNASSVIHRLSNPNKVEAKIEPGKEYIAFDDHIYSGSTVTNLVGQINKNGGVCKTIMCLAKNPIVKELKLRDTTLKKIQESSVYSKIENDWKGYFGFGFDCLTEVEANLLIDNYVDKNLNIMNKIQDYKLKPYVPTYDKSLWPLLTETESVNSLEELGMKGYYIKIINKIKK